MSFASEMLNTYQGSYLKGSNAMSPYMTSRFENSLAG